jgi:GNAT superfamily N-acetyltransferase
MRDGYTDLPPGKLANVVTHLEMRTAPPAGVTPTTSEFAVRRVNEPNLESYRRLFRAIGENWLWFSRLRLSDEELRAIVHDPAIDIYVLSDTGMDCGLLEFDRRQMPDIEISFFGVTQEVIGKGAGRALLAYCLPLAWQHKTQRIWLHTCTSDHPAAMPFYLKFGFVAYKRAIEISDDPRVTGEMARNAAPHVPIV